MNSWTMRSVTPHYMHSSVTKLSVYVPVVRIKKYTCFLNMKNYFSPIVLGSLYYCTLRQYKLLKDNADYSSCLALIELFTL